MENLYTTVTEMLWGASQTIFASCISETEKLRTTGESWAEMEEKQNEMITWLLKDCGR